MSFVRNTITVYLRYPSQIFLLDNNVIMKIIHIQFVLFTGNFRFWFIYSIRKSWQCYAIWMDNHYKDKNVRFVFRAETTPILNMTNFMYWKFILLVYIYAKIKSVWQLRIFLNQHIKINLNYTIDKIVSTWI